jgi:uncharacterized protein
MPIVLSSDGTRRKVAYRGFAFPFRKGVNSFPADATDENLIRDSIKQIILTGLGERVMRPTFGSDFYRFIMENNTDLLEELFRLELRSSIGSFEPRVIIQNIQITRRENIIDITVFYILSLNNQPGQVSIPIADPNVSQGGL